MSELPTQEDLRIQIIDQQKHIAKLWEEGDELTVKNDKLEQELAQIKEDLELEKRHGNLAAVLLAEERAKSESLRNQMLALTTLLTEWKVDCRTLRSENERLYSDNLAMIKRLEKLEEKGGLHD